MIEAAMFIALGFLLAALLSLAILPAVYRRAVRLTQEAMKAINPSTYAEVRGAQDYERAQHALTVLRLEKALEQQREQAVAHRLEAGKLTVDLVRLKAEHDKALRDIRQPAETSGNEAAAGKKTEELSAELDTVKHKLQETEQALAAAQAEVDVLKATSEAEPGWRPADDTMALATITGLESQIATLKARLAKFEGGEITVEAGDLNTNSEEMKAQVKQLENQLVDTETQFISAQAEVTRLTLQIESVETPHDEVIERLERDLKWADGEKARLTALTRDRERAVARAQSQIQRLRQDLNQAPQLARLREDLVDLTAKLLTPDDNGVKDAPAAAEETNDVQTPVNALVNRIVKSSQANADTSAQSAGRGTSSKEASASPKRKKRDVA